MDLDPSWIKYYLMLRKYKISIYRFQQKQFLICFIPEKFNSVTFSIGRDHIVEPSDSNQP